MDKELKAKWVEALRGGKYEQGRSRLYRPETKTYCCLGVLAEVAKFRSSSDYSLRDSVNEFRLLSQDEQGVLMDLNDSREKSFAQIADYVEANL